MLGAQMRPTSDAASRPQPTQPFVLRLFRVLGPGFITGTSDDDPSAIGTYAQAGAQFGTLQLWSALFSFPFMAAIQEMCGRIGAVTGRGLGSVIRLHYVKPVLYVIVFIQVLTNTINIGADLSAMAQSAQLLWHVPYYVLLLAITVLTLALVVLVPYHVYAFYLRFLGLALLTYIVTAFTVKVDWLQVVRATFAPSLRFDKAYWLNIVAVFGTTISSYEFFWQASQEVEEGVVATSGAMRFLRWDTIFGMFFSNLIMFFIILTAAFTLGKHGVGNIDTAAQAAEMLRPLAGPATFVLFTVGIVSAGLLALPVLAGSSAYAICDTFGWPCSLEKNFHQEPAFYRTIILSALLGLAINLLPIPPFKLLYYTAILSGIIAPPLLFIVVQIAGSRKIMGAYVNSLGVNVMGWLLFAFMSLALVALLVSLRSG